MTSGGQDGGRVRITLSSGGGRTGRGENAGPRNGQEEVRASGHVQSAPLSPRVAAVCAPPKPASLVSGRSRGHGALAGAAWVGSGRAGRDGRLAWLARRSRLWSRRSGSLGRASARETPCVAGRPWSACSGGLAVRPEFSALLARLGKRAGPAGPRRSATVR